ncbi:uncharacterized protein IL334_001636 [Kwoniella shivajii]|uniref:Arabinanase/levansucrase/invertase n=1 Tax=Kwoniella shivajii TaxID=564305 RepID=A0ABZ1CSG3_9TREE|nr:hypothetical protein IL334_001636 [Kwoniella shivajii]
MIFTTLFASCLLGVATAATFTNPLRPSGPDPFIVYDHDTSSYLFMQTNGDALRVTKSPTLAGISDYGNEHLVLQTQEMKDKPTVWAGEIHKIDGIWYIYYSHADAVYVVTGTKDPVGSYKNPVKLYDKGWGIDGTVLVVGVNNYFVWSCHSEDVSDNNIGGSSICISPLTSPTKIDQDRISIISRPEQAWEETGGKTNEGPQPLYWGDQIFITYSASFCSTADYSLGLLHLSGDDPMNAGAWIKKTDGPVFKTGNGEYGPGHNGMFLSPDKSELWNIYHATTNSAGSCGNDRSTFAQKVDGTNGLDFGIPVGPGQSEGPSGEDTASKPAESDINAVATSSKAVTDVATTSTKRRSQRTRPAVRMVNTVTVRREGSARSKAKRARFAEDDDVL